MSTLLNDRMKELAGIAPPSHLTVNHGKDQFRQIGERWAETFQLLAKVNPTDCVLDVGCGPGRMALALVPYIGLSGRYEGFDINPNDIAWCKKEIETRWSRSHFTLADLYNAHYNPTGALCADQFRFPYDDQSFDFVFLTSVFTHLLPDDLRNYFHEISRVLRPGGRCLITYFLLNDAVHKSIEQGHARFTFDHELFPHCRVQYLDRPEDVVAYEEAFVREQYRLSDLSILEPIHYGAWSRQPLQSAPRHGQDIIIGIKVPADHEK